MSLRHGRENHIYAFAHLVFGIFLVLFPTIPPLSKRGAGGIYPDFAIDADSITFSNDSPMEGEEVVIKVMVKNIGYVEPTMNETLEVWKRGEKGDF